jgi:hypothetical protein
MKWIRSSLLGTPVRRKPWTMIGLSALTLAFVIIVMQTQTQAHVTSPISGPTASGALSAEEAINHALLTSNVNALEARLADDWVVVSGFGDMNDKSGFIDVRTKIKQNAAKSCGVEESDRGRERSRASDAYGLSRND